MKNLAALVGGTVFGMGLVISHMTNPDKVLAFLTLNANWDPALIFVLGSAFVTAMVGFRLVTRRTQPLFSAQFHLPQNSKIDRRLVVGATIFGLGWGVSGFCPGPAIVGALTFDARAFLFLTTFVIGLYCYEFTANVSSPQRPLA